MAQAGKSRKNEMDVSFAKNIELNDTGGYTDIYIYSMYIYNNVYIYIYIYLVGGLEHGFYFSIFWEE